MPENTSNEESLNQPIQNEASSNQTNELNFKQVFFISFFTALLTAVSTALLTNYQLTKSFDIWKEQQSLIRYRAFLDKKLTAANEFLEIVSNTETLRHDAANHLQHIRLFSISVKSGKIESFGEIQKELLAYSDKFKLFAESFNKLAASTIYLGQLFNQNTKEALEKSNLRFIKYQQEGRILELYPPEPAVVISGFRGYLENKPSELDKLIKFLNKYLLAEHKTLLITDIYSDAIEALNNEIINELQSDH